MQSHASYDDVCSLSLRMSWVSKKLDDFVIKSIIAQSAQVLNQGKTMEKFQQQILDVIGPLSRLWKGL